MLHLKIFVHFIVKSKYKEDGTFEKYLPLRSNPDMVIMDTEVIAKAPVRFLVAGIGDALATCYEAEACEQSGIVTMAGGQSTLFTTE